MEQQTLIVGAGPYGVAIALELERRGVPFRIFGEPFALWLHHTFDRMLLRSAPQASDIPSHDRRYNFVEYLERQGHVSAPEDRLNVEVFRGFLREVVGRLPFDIERQRIERLERLDDGSGYLAHDSSGQAIPCRSVIVATGCGDHRHLPPSLADLPSDRVLHSWQAQEIEDLEDRRVLVVGGGQSAAEAVGTLVVKNRVTWAMRHEPFFFREPLRLPTPLFNGVLRLSPVLDHLPPVIYRSFARACFRTTITPDLRQFYDREDTDILFADAEELHLEAAGDGLKAGIDGTVYDAVVSATGYKYRVAGVPFLSTELRRALGGDQAVPHLDRAFQTPVQGLFFAGGIAEGTFGPAQRFLFGSRHAARRIGEALGS